MAKMWAPYVILFFLLVLSPGRTQPSTNGSVSLTVKVLSVYGFVVELYDETGELIGRTHQAALPLDIEMTMPGGQTIGLQIQDTALSGPAIIQIYIAGTVPNRGIIDQADNVGRAVGMIPIPELEAIEIVSDNRLDGRATIMLSYPSSIERALARNLAIFGLDGSTPGWIRLAPVKVDHFKRRILVRFDGFSVYRVMAQVATDLTDVVVYPNPFMPPRAPDGCLKFVNLTSEAAIRIYNVTGDLIWKEDILDGVGHAQWNAVNDRMKPVASGIYVYVVTNSSGKKAVGKVLVIR